MPNIFLQFKKKGKNAGCCQYFIFVWAPFNLKEIIFNHDRIAQRCLAHTWMEAVAVMWQERVFNTWQRCILAHVCTRLCVYLSMCKCGCMCVCVHVYEGHYQVLLPKAVQFGFFFTEITWLFKINWFRWISHSVTEKNKSSDFYFHMQK